MDRRLEVAIAAAKAGGEAALRHFRRRLDVEIKADRSPVTAADREAENAVRRVLERAFPEEGFLGEEAGECGPRDRRWIVDPIDGTRNFVRGIPLFATLVAYEQDGVVMTGVVHAPAMGELLYAQRGCGAFDGRQQRLRVSQVAELSEAMLLFGGLNVLREHGLWAAFERLVDRSERQRAFGDYFGYTFIARGQAEAMLETDVKPWDLAALQVIVEEAGGRFTDVEGNATIYGGSAVASNGHVHDAILRVVRGAGEEYGKDG